MTSLFGRNALRGHRFARFAGLITLVFVAAALATTGLIPKSAFASTGITKVVYNADGGVYWRSAPNWSDALANPGHGVYNGSVVELNCWTTGGTVPPYWNNSLWYDATVMSGPGTGTGYVNDHFINTGINKPNVVVSGVPKCGGVTLATAPKPPSTINGVDVGYPQNSPHWWGSCYVQDFNGGPYGWVIASYTNGIHLVRNGMLWGWFDNGGASGKLGCPSGDEFGYKNSSSMAGVRQDFQHGSLYWVSGMNHAALISSRQEAAIGWAWSHLNRVFWPGFCLQFAVFAYNDTGWHLTGPYGNNVSAVDWWSSAAVPSPQHSGDMNPPRGALVFWSHWDGGSGHAAISLGGGWVISTEFGGNSAVHVFKIASFPSYYLGWRNPA